MNVLTAEGAERDNIKSGTIGIVAEIRRRQCRFPTILFSAIIVSTIKLAGLRYGSNNSS